MTRARSVDPGAAPGRRATRSKAFDLVYRIGLLLKAVDGSFEVVAGIVLWFFPHALARLIEPFAVTEVGRHPMMNLIVLGGFTVYQAVLLVVSPTVGMLLLTLLDLAIIVLVWREWRVVRAEGAAVALSARDGGEEGSPGDPTSLVR